MVLKLALLGSGIFIRQAHLPVIMKDEGVVVKAVYSRSTKSAQAIVDDFKLSGADVYSNEGAKGIEELLKRDDIDAVLIALPILENAKYVKLSLDAGKHVLSEKPIAESMEAAEKLIKYHQSMGKKAPIWGVAENYRYTQSFVKGAQALSKMGKMTSFNVQKWTLNTEDNVWMKDSPWRQAPQFQGGFILDGCVHQAAGLRMLLGSKSNPVVKISGFVKQNLPYLPPVDTVNSIMLCKDGTSGTFSASFGTTRDSSEVCIQCEKGYVICTPPQIVIHPLNGEKEVHDMASNDGTSAIERELTAFFKSVSKGSLDPQLNPVEAYLDLALIESILKSGDQQGALQTVPTTL